MWLRVLFVWLPIGLKIPERYFMCFHVATRGICMAFNRSEDSFRVFHVFYVATRGIRMASNWSEDS